jgi:hypothetical protein
VLIGILGIVMMTFAIALLILWVRKRWSMLQPELFPDVTVADEAEAVSGFRSWLTKIPSILDGSREMALDSFQNNVDAVSSGQHIRKSDWLSIRETAQAIAVNALDANDVQSTLLELSGIYVYLVVVPNRHEHPSLLQKYSCFASGWFGHVRLLRDSLAHEAGFNGLECFLMFIAPDGEDGVLLCSLANKEAVAVPASLVPLTDRRLVSSGQEGVVWL